MISPQPAVHGPEPPVHVALSKSSLHVVVEVVIGAFTAVDTQLTPSGSWSVMTTLVLKVLPVFVTTTSYENVSPGDSGAPPVEDDLVISRLGMKTGASAAAEADVWLDVTCTTLVMRSVPAGTGLSTTVSNRTLNEAPGSMVPSRNPPSSNGKGVAAGGDASSGTEKAPAPKSATAEPGR